MISVQFIEAFWLLVLVPLLGLLYFLYRRRNRAIARKIGDPALVQQLIARNHPRAAFFKFIFLALAVCAFVVTLANVRTKAGEQKVNRKGIDFMIALDVSKSMLAQDVKPTRLDRAKQFLNRLIDKLGTNRVGIVIFAGKAYLQMPLTGDIPAAKMFLSAAGTESVPTQGTVIGDALKMCYAAFNNKEKKYKAVLLISDGEDHDENALKIAEQMSTSGVIIHTVGIGSPGGAPLIDQATNQYKKDGEGNTVITKLNEELLQSVSQKGRGTYQLFQNSDNVVANITTQLASMEQRTVTDDSLINYESFFQVFLVLAFLLLITELLWPERKKITVMKTMSKRMAAVLLLNAFVISATAQDDQDAVKQGNKAYTDKEYSKAADAYSTALQKNPNNPAAKYNMGNAQYRLGKKEEAMTAYDDAIQKLQKPVDKSNAWHNKGVILQKDNKLPECIEAYKNALKFDPSNEDARQNLQKALKQMQQQKEQEEKKKNNQQKQPNKQNQEPRPQPSKLTKQDAENKLKALLQKEKELQGKLHKINASSNTPEKDW